MKREDEIKWCTFLLIAGHEVVRALRVLRIVARIVGREEPAAGGTATAAIDSRRTAPITADHI